MNTVNSVAFYSLFFLVSTCLIKNLISIFLSPFFLYFFLCNHLSINYLWVDCQWRSKCILDAAGSSAGNVWYHKANQSDRRAALPGSRVSSSKEPSENEKCLLGNQDVTWVLCGECGWTNVIELMVINAHPRPCSRARGRVALGITGRQGQPLSFASLPREGKRKGMKLES